ncbi:MAG TPA: hypothetical protein VLI21_04675 [Casimicrobiaceae bacterium]|nr:hypothetical protein [Casimicrobiaceae bacterium]
MQRTPSPAGKATRIADTDPYLHLVALGGERLPHVSGTLAAHLRRTENLLRSWGSRDALCVAGLYHAVYGTAGIRDKLLDVSERGSVAEVIGAEAEAIAYLYGACDRGRYHPRIGTAMQFCFADRFTGAEYLLSAASLRDFCELTVANELELATTSEWFRQRCRRELCVFFDRMQGLISDGAVTAYRRALGHHAR